MYLNQTLLKLHPVWNSCCNINIKETATMVWLCLDETNINHCKHIASLENRIIAAATIAKRPCAFNLPALLRPNPNPMMLGLGATGTFGFPMGEEAGETSKTLTYNMMMIHLIENLFTLLRQKSYDLSLEKLENQMNPEGKATLKENIKPINQILKSRRECKIINSEDLNGT
ncbi:hypothetical protein EPI10_016194 [Gossypium australe]|uniref:Uncharacterized protein n=1 Tax=Gossypium australe TaxID=47621 RepID=A0A5B6VN22_9ROSI|nr:hypothetical protein EPI10_016194 [Gossypium australe]